MREVALLAIVVAVMFPLWPYAEVETTDYPEARSEADRLQDVLESVWQGDISIEDAAIPDGVRLYDFTVGGRTTWVLTHSQPTAAGTCYGMRTGGGMVTLAVRFAPTDGCVPQSHSAFEAKGSWDDVLPRARVTPLWFVPVVGVLGGCALASASSIVMKLAFK
ncbi:MAG: hypothetical protein QNJ77_02675 [Acidimicrobiia bacterium]|nr:hypothetical protein [Acidimicrobiia bacterium]